MGKTIEIPPTWAVTARFEFKDGFSKEVSGEICAPTALEAFESDNIDGLDLSDLDSLKDEYEEADITALRLEVRRVA